MNVARVSLALLAVVAAVAVVTPASASDGTCLMSNGAEPAPEGSVTISWHGGGGFVERCTSTAGTGAEPVAQDPMASLPPAAQTPTAVVPSRAAKPTARPTARAVKAKQAKKAKAKRKSAQERKRAKARHAKCQVRR